jgi:hypothetical protein
MGSLLAVDLGLKTGLALYGHNGRLCWYRSKNYGTTAALKRGAHTLLNSIPDLSFLVMEGGGTVAAIWEREAIRRNIPVQQINAEKWRQKLLYPREQHTGLQAKHFADDLARRTITWSGISRPSSLRHDTAEAILIGLWAVLDAGWLKEMPQELKR